MTLPNRLIFVLLFAGCGARPEPPGTLRYRNADPVWRVSLGTPIAKPAKRAFLRDFYFFDQQVYRPVDRALALPSHHRAENINALGDVPDSAWFENRIGRHELSAEAIAAGPSTDEGPVSPLTVLSDTTGGKSLGFFVKDARGVRYLLKLDRVHAPVVETAAHIVAHRLLWAVGYRVPEDRIVHLRKEDLRVAPDATTRGFAGRDDPLTQSLFDQRLAGAAVGEDGTIRGLSSKILPGKVLGGFPQTGVREDDANDLIAHERHRELRGMVVFYSWLKSTDMKTDNTLDLWVPTDGDPSKGRVFHYLIDFGKSLGADSVVTETDGDGYTRALSLGEILKYAFAFGLAPRHWESFAPPPAPDLGVLETTHYRPGDFESRITYLPWLSADRFDTFWAAKLLAKLTEQQIRAAVRAASYPTSRSAELLVQVLLERQRIALRHWFDKVVAIDDIQVTGDEICFVDLVARHRLRTAPVRFRVTVFDYQGRKLGARELRRTGERHCAAIPRGQEKDAYTIARITMIRRPDLAADIHIANAPTETPRVIGIRQR